jgi:hypothetical protein
LKFAIDDMQIGSANTAGADPDANLSRARDGIGTLPQRQRRARALEDHAEHLLSLSFFPIVAILSGTALAPRR